MTPVYAFILGMICMLFVVVIGFIAFVLFVMGSEDDHDDDQWTGHRRGYGEF